MKGNSGGFFFLGMKNGPKQKPRGASCWSISAGSLVALSS